MGGDRRSWTAGLIGGIAFALLAVGARADERSAAVRSDVVMQALSLLGAPYRYGGASPEAGFDCSGLVRHVFSSALARDLPRRSEEMSAVGHPVSRSDLQPGDLVFFDTLRRAFSHVAIYIGQGRFVHAPARRGRVRIENLDDRYWAARFNGARRLIEPVPAGTPVRVGAGPPSVTPLPARPEAAAPGGVFDDRPPGP